MKTFIAFNVEVAECELAGSGFPATQKGAEAWVKSLDRKRSKSMRRRSQAAYGNNFYSGQVV